MYRVLCCEWWVLPPRAMRVTLRVCVCGGGEAWCLWNDACSSARERERLSPFERAKAIHKQCMDEEREDAEQHGASWSVFGWIRSVEHLTTPIACALMRADAQSTATAAGAALVSTEQSLALLHELAILGRLRHHELAGRHLERARERARTRREAAATKVASKAISKRDAGNDGGTAPLPLQGSPATLHVKGG